MSRTQLLVLAFGIGPGLRLARLERRRLDADPGGAAAPCRKGTTPADAADARRDRTFTVLERQ